MSELPASDVNAVGMRRRCRLATFVADNIRMAVAALSRERDTLMWSERERLVSYADARIERAIRCRDATRH